MTTRRDANPDRRKSHHADLLDRHDARRIDPAGYRPAQGCAPVFVARRS
jgi:hypothetical protein